MTTIVPLGFKSLRLELDVSFCVELTAKLGGGEYPSTNTNLRFIIKDSPKMYVSDVANASSCQDPRMLHGFCVRLPVSAHGGCVCCYMGFPL